MKNIAVFATLILSQTLCSQVSGNINYRHQTQYPETTINIATPVADPDLNERIISVKGMANVKAEKYVAIFSVTQVDESAEEVNSLIENRITNSILRIKSYPGAETYVDMISFVPVYQYNAEKKTSSKKTYNEVPAGFELKKNIHIKFQDPSQLNDFIAILSKNEIYDLVRVDYFAGSIENIRKELMAKAKSSLEEKMKNLAYFSGEDFTYATKNINDGFRTLLPTEMYKSYEAYNSSSLALTRFANVNPAAKSVTLYYQPVLDKEFDFVINPVIHEPVIQILYEIKLSIKRNPEREKAEMNALKRGRKRFRLF